MTVSEAEKTTYIETAKVLKGSDRRMFMARIVQNLGPSATPKPTWAGAVIPSAKGRTN